jgi:hypothetical protein
MADAHPFERIAGTWRGAGAGSYPTIADFSYTEELAIEPVPGRPVAHWRARTRDAATGEPRHAESGFLRAMGADAADVELVLAHNFGLVETATGWLDAEALTLRSTSVVGTPTAKSVDEVHRWYRFGDGELHYELSMAAVGVELTHHLRATLQRDAG